MSNEAKRIVCPKCRKISRRSKVPAEGAEVKDGFSIQVCEICIKAFKRLFRAAQAPTRKEANETERRPWSETWEWTYVDEIKKDLNDEEDTNPV